MRGHKNIYNDNGTIAEAWYHWYYNEPQSMSVGVLLGVSSLMMHRTLEHR